MEFLVSAHDVVGGGRGLVAGSWIVAGLARVRGCLAETMCPTIEHLGGFNHDVGRCGRGARRRGNNCGGDRDRRKRCSKVGVVETGGGSSQVFNADLVGVVEVLLERFISLGIAFTTFPLVDVL